MNKSLADSAREVDLLRKLQTVVPKAKLTELLLPDTGGISLLLIDESYPQDALSEAQISQLMDTPPYWAFCWASGWVMAQWLKEHPKLVREKVVLDFGCGSGVAGIAAIRAGAREVIFCDSDADARLATIINCELNGVAESTYRFISDLAELGSVTSPSGPSVSLVADVFYDRDNLPLLETLNASTDVLVADSRLGGQPLRGMEIVHKRTASTLPDLDESVSFRDVTLYQSSHQSSGG
ncbi:MAG: 50S ribosomal protein L11 methyltransferase [Pseudomonadota bacterium]